MLKYVLSKSDDAEMQYTYYPEGNSAPGVVSYNKNTGECTIITLAPGDEHQIYALKMMGRIRAFVARNSFENEGMVAWY